MVNNQVAQERFRQKMRAESGIDMNASSLPALPIIPKSVPTLPDRFRKTKATIKTHRARTSRPSTFTVSLR